MPKSPYKIVFMGTPQFAVPYLKSLITDKDFKVEAVLTRPDKPAGRKQVMTPPPVKIIAEENTIEILQPEKLKENKEIITSLKIINPDLVVVVAYGQIIPQEILDIPKIGNINVHPSLLPKYRGASPIQNAILNQEKITGLTIMLMDEKMDHGPILAQKEIILDSAETNESLHQAMSDKSSTDFFIKTLKQFVNGDLKPQAQDHSQATYCRLISKEEARINWHDLAENISAKIRGFYPWPLAWTTLHNKRMKLFPPIEIIETTKKPGEIFSFNKKMAIACQDQSIILSTLQLEGKNRVLAANFLLGNKKIVGSNFDGD